MFFDRKYITAVRDAVKSRVFRFERKLPFEYRELMLLLFFIYFYCLFTIKRFETHHCAARRRVYSVVECFYAEIVNEFDSIREKTAARAYKRAASCIMRRQPNTTEHGVQRRSNRLLRFIICVRVIRNIMYILVYLINALNGNE